jgi:prevent-host-death family protein
MRSEDIIPINQVRARFSELAEAVRKGEEKIITRKGESYVALIDSRRLDHYHQLEREYVHVQLLEEALRGLEDVDAGRTLTPAQLRARLKKRRTK